jgi:hypothetical protein
MAVAARGGPLRRFENERSWLVGFLFIVVSLILFDHMSRRVNPSAAEIYEAIRTAPYKNPVPPGFRLSRVVGHPPSDKNGPGVSLLLYEIESSTRYSGSPLLIQYRIAGSHSEALGSFEKYWSSLRNEEKAHDTWPRADRLKWERSHPTELFTLPGVSTRHLCAEDPGLQDYCQAVVGKVYIEVLSRTQMLRLGDEAHLGQLMSGAISHLERALP